MTDNWKQVSIAVTGLGAADNPAPGVAVARSLRAAGHTGTLIGLAYDTGDTGLYSRELFDRIYLIPYPSSGAGPLLDSLRKVQEETGLALVLPTLDSEMDVYLAVQEELTALDIHCYLPDTRALKLRAKTRLEEFCRSQEIPTPETRVIQHMGQLEDTWEELRDPSGRVPVWVKGVFYEAQAAWTLPQAEYVAADIVSRWGFPLVLQRGIEGFEYNVCCLGSGDGAVQGMVAMRKLAVTSKGKAWSGVTVSDPELLAFSRRVIQSLKWRGPCELEILCTGNEHSLSLLEINPRFPAWTWLCTGAGVNLPAAQAMLAMGETPDPLPAARSGVIYSRAAVDMICDLGVLEDLSTSGRTVYREK